MAAIVGGPTNISTAISQSEVVLVHRTPPHPSSIPPVPPASCPLNYHPLPLEAFSDFLDWFLNRIPFSAATAAQFAVICKHLIRNLQFVAAEGPERGKELLSMGLLFGLAINFSIVCAASPLSSSDQLPKTGSQVVGLQLSAAVEIFIA